MWFDQPPDNRILTWREWRNSLADLPAETVLHRVATDWGRAPTVLHYLSPDQPNDWPTPWQLIVDNIYCDLSVCLGMFYTLALIEQFRSCDLELAIYQDSNGWINLSSMDQGKYVLNYHHGDVVNMSCVQTDQMKLIFSYSKFDLYDKFN